MKCWPALPLLAVLSACVSQQPAAERPASAAEQQQQAAALYLDAVRGLIARQQYFAAVAHIAEDRRSHGDSPPLRLLEADARRNLGQVAEARKLYSGLLIGPLAGDANRGLGLIAAAAGNLGAAIPYFKAAVALKPVDVDVRNDLGFALMQAGRYAEARTELATALELAPGQTKSRNNLLILLLAAGDDAAVRRVLAASEPIDAALLARLRAEAQSLKSQKKGS